MNENPSLKKREEAEVQRPQEAQPGNFDQPSRLPAVAVSEAEESVLIEVDLPGVKADQLQLSINQGVLVLNAPVVTSPREGFQLIHREYDEVAFRRAFTLPDDIDAGEISANAKNGVVTITLPKSKAALPRRIAVKTQ